MSLLALLVLWLHGACDRASARDIVIDGAETFQTIDGFGVNANHRSFENNELQPVLDALIDDAGMTLFRVVFDNADWEAVNDNNDPNVINWDYFGTIYSQPDFQKMWAMMAYLNQKGITNGLMPNIQGFAPWWMSSDRSLVSGFEDEWAEMIASFYIYARYTNHLQFHLIAPNNEPDLPGSGVGISNALQYAITLHKLSEKLDANGLSDLRFVGPDLAVSSTNWLPGIMEDSVVMGKLAHFGLHSYSDYGSFSSGVDDFLKQSAYPASTFWMTEFGISCDTCQYGTHGTNTWDYARLSAEALLYHLAANASGALVWEGYDSHYFNNWDDNMHWSFWGLFALNDTNAVPKIYTPRKIFYSLAQITKFVRPGAHRINVVPDDADILDGFYHPDSGQLTLAGINSSDAPKTLAATITNLPALKSLDLYYTDAGNNLVLATTIPVVSNSFSVLVPPNSVYTVVSPAIPNPVLTLSTNGNGTILPDFTSQSLTRGKTYTLVAIPASGQTFTGWSGDLISASPRLVVKMDSDISMQANFAPASFSPARNIYTGLFYESDAVSTLHSGGFTLNSTAKGAFTGKIQLGGRRFSFKGSFDSGGHSVVSIVRHGLTSLSLTLQTVTNDSFDGLTGSVTDGSWIALLSASRSSLDGKTTLAAKSGVFDLIFTPDTISADRPAGTSYAVITIDKSGHARISGSLADGTKVIVSSRLSATGEIPMFNPLYAGGGSLLGWLSVTNSATNDVSGSVTWNKPASPKAKLYPAGFTSTTTVSGSAYLRPHRGVNILSLSNAEADFTGGNLAADLSIPVTLGANNRVNDPSRSLKLTFSTGTGMFRGTVKTSAQTKALPFGGVVLQKRNLASGYFINSVASGQVSLIAPVSSGN